MVVRYQGQADYECEECDIILSAKNGSKVKCPNCQNVMIKLFGGRANSEMKDYKWRDSK